MMPVSEDTEITLGTGKMLAIFFGLVALCAVFFAMGFSLGKSTARVAGGPEAPPPAVATIRPSANKQSATAPDLNFYKNVAQKDAEPAPSEKAAQQTPDEPSATSPDSTSPPVMNGHYVQVAAGTKQEDAEAWEVARNEKQYSAFDKTTAKDNIVYLQV